MRTGWQNGNGGRGYAGSADGTHPGQVYQQTSRPLGGMEGSGVWEMPRGAPPSAGDSGVYGWPRNGEYPPGAVANGNSLAGVASSQQRSQPQRVAQVPAGDAVLRRPRRAPDVRDLMIVVNTHGLSRSHRTILLLADGHHTVLDLARLSSKAVEEVVALLEELEGKGLVYYYE
jgi:hypothetical protein